MTTFSPTDAALEGFRLTRERPRAFATWSVFQFGVSLVMGFVIIKLGGQHLMALESVGASGDADPAAVMAEFRALAPLYAVLLPIGLLMMSVVTAAVYRSILEPADDRWGYLRIGADELRLAALRVIYIFVWGGIVFAVVLVAALAAGLATAVSGAAGGIVGVGVGLFAIGILIYVAVRLSLAPAITFAEHRISIFESWKLTRGMFWRLLGAYALAVASIVVVALLAMVIFTAVAGVAIMVGGGELTDASAAYNPDMTSLSSYFTVLTVAYLAFAGVLAALYYAVITAPGAMAYRALKAADAGVTSA